ncbi:hypothetical protein [Legionella spiritensis]|uniref:hypothetical protein n=1 Tax=Legionella spiritensis TaxID=452 RepID=UPI000F6C1190|nr:hypothetical protein [Legionella spiritensis]VEG92513.1 Uncharacterised protein [Legionella spiritensis]VEG92593.1 Uncharacterised protein [Legionella spiritensis]
MDTEIRDMISQLYEDLDFTASEQKLIDYSNDPHSDVINHTRVLSTVLLAKELKKSTEAIIESNKVLATAENKNSKVMQNLTWALVFVGFLQALGVLINLFK